MKEILMIVASIIVAFGGASGIITLTAKWLGNIIAESLLKKQQAKYDNEIEKIKQSYQKEVEKYKNELQIICENVKCDNAKNIYVTEKQFDIEIDLIKELTEKALVFELRAKVLFAQYDQVPKDEIKRKELESQRYQEYVDAHNDFVNILGKSRAFIDSDIYESYGKLYNLCQKQNFWYMAKVFNNAVIGNKDLSECYNRSIEIEAANEKTNLLIKSYLAKLKIVGGTINGQA